MILIITAENRSLFESELIEMHRQRKAVFVDGYGWSVPVKGDMEVDGYDGESTTYLIARWSGGEAIASAHEMTAVAASITPVGLRATRDRLGVHGQVTRFPLPAIKIAA